MDPRILNIFPQLTNAISLKIDEPIKPVQSILNSLLIQVIFLPPAEDEEEFFDVNETAEEEFFDCEETPEEHPMIVPELDDSALETGFFGLVSRVANTVIDVMESDRFLKLSAILKSTLGDMALQSVMGAAASVVGSAIGQAFPAVSIAYVTGSTIAEKVLGNSDENSMMIKGMGVVTAIAAVTINQVTGVDAGVMGQFFGPTAGRLMALEAVRRKVEDKPSFILRSAVSDAVSLAGTLVGNGLAANIAAVAVYHAPEIKMAVDKIMHPAPINLYNPFHFIQKVIKDAFGDTEKASKALAMIFGDTLVKASIMKVFIKSSVNTPVVTNAFVRAINAYATVIQGKFIQQKIEQLRKDEGKREELKQEIAEMIYTDVFSDTEKYGPVERMLARVVQGKAKSVVPGMAEAIANKLESKEKQYSGMTSNAAKNKDMLEALLPTLLPLIGVYVGREMPASSGSFFFKAITYVKNLIARLWGQTTVEEDRGLTPEELAAFYKNMNGAFLAPYSDTLLGQVAKIAIDAATPVMQDQNVQIIPEMVAKLAAEYFAG